ncbi:hydroxymethylbilane synthase [Corynebacterium nuruki]|jgi:hydroxymethylbilane synthase|uniref:Hydroxymethylbilane synthase n=1 Tax=Corynebacterium nuruki TaxID=1032851 RepID=A0A3D4SWL1_9CORY|nr:hydroxymethylbilane synthase [Corynebacterium nuruki]HCT13391.1 hydroxymethylbilane synthase [Corynebacterium nuruki]
MRTLLVGTRASVLARTQAGTVSDALTAGGDPAELHFVHTPGDASQKAQTPVNRIGVGVFTETLRNALAAGECDVAVHSFKDLPTAPDPRFIQVVPLRADAREVLVSLDNIRLRDLPQGAQIGTGAPRRVAQIRGLRPDLGCVPIRGNIDTRMGRVGDGSGEGDLAAVVLARAGLERVGGLARAAETVDPADIMPAPAQGALCVEVRADDAEAVAAVRALDDHVSHARAVAERQILATLQAGCTAPVGAWSEVSNGRMLLRGGVFALDGSRRLVRETTGAFDGADHDHAAAAELGARIGRELLEEGAAEIMAAAAPSGPL